MKRFLTSLVLVFFGCLIIHAQKFAYPVSDIPDSLYENAKAVIRENNIQIEIEALNCVKINEIKAITIFDKSGDKYANGLFNYSKLNVITDLHAVIYNEFGERIKSYSQKDFRDMSYDSYGSLYSDTRLLYLSGASSNYPYTIVYRVSYIKKYTYDIPDWNILDGYNMSLQNGSLEVITPIRYKLNYEELNTSLSPSISTENQRKIYRWQTEGIMAINYEPYAPVAGKIFPSIKLSPSEFQYEGYFGNMDNWREFGLFRTRLNEGLTDNLSDETKTELNGITKNCDSQLEKAKAVYEYMQEKTRYVSIQEGIGGIQPFDAKVVEEFGYGDCKALTNYTMALLNEVGIKSYYSVVQAGRGAYWFDTAFVEHFSNHVILNVPIDDKDYWLECTSQIMPFGFLGDFTNDRLALVITETGGILKKTTSYSMEHNKTSRRAEVYINSDGMGKAQVKTTYSGIEYDDILFLIHDDYEEQKDYLYERHIDIPDFKINSFCFDDYPSMYPHAVEKLDLELINYASSSGSRLFIPLNLMNQFDDVPRKERDRKNPIVIFREFATTDTIVFQLPDGYSIEHIPDNDTVEYDFGKLEYSVRANGQEVEYIRHFELFRQTYPKERYNDFVSFCREMKKADKAKLILVKL